MLKRKQELSLFASFFQNIADLRISIRKEAGKISISRCKNSESEGRQLLQSRTVKTTLVYKTQGNFMLERTIEKSNLYSTKILMEGGSPILFSIEEKSTTSENDANR
jgi:late competence protein required for DNA uptake (superfamily II DNA/RNA helicase)